MPHKFKIGTIVNYYPKDRMLSTARGTYTITKLMPAIAGQQPEYRIKHFSEEFERVAFEKELSAG
jgi:predicted metallopeptidase